MLYPPPPFHEVSFKQLLKEYQAFEKLLGPLINNLAEFGFLRVQWLEGASAYQGALILDLGEMKLADYFTVEYGDPDRVRRQMLDHFEQRVDWAAQLAKKYEIKLDQDSSVEAFLDWAPPET